jgi:hypothetical protein
LDWRRSCGCGDHGGGAGREWRGGRPWRIGYGEEPRWWLIGWLCFCKLQVRFEMGNWGSTGLQWWDWVGDLV